MLDTLIIISALMTPSPDRAVPVMDVSPTPRKAFERVVASIQPPKAQGAIVTQKVEVQK